MTGCHLHNQHGPPEAREPHFPAFAAFAWVVCQRESDGKFIMVNEPAGICRAGRPGYWLPAGRVDEGETFVEAAVREAEEEAGVAVEVTGLLRCMLSDGVPRIVMLARPTAGHGTPKAIPDFESVGAMFVDAAELAALGARDYRAPDPAKFFPRVASGELVPQSIDTDAWRALETAVARATRVVEGGGGGGDDNFARAWADMVRAYPPELFA